ncbi:hypothetical protein [Dickeya dadantii]|uniref:hypothetical protein n=1 Tax=Dickeya dadantii TaxID=204038 RepID=UPI001F341AD6|nr:hypothetical protein [Dickeya dadantii]
MEEDIDVVINVNVFCQEKFLEHKSKLNKLGCIEQKLMVMQYFNILNELSTQACDCLKSNRLSVVEVLTRVIMEQVANQSYIAADDGKNSQSLLIACKKCLLKTEIIGCRTSTLVEKRIQRHKKELEWVIF